MTTGTSFLSSFADDTWIGHQIQDSEDVQELQADLEKVYEWETTNNMEFNAEKFKLLRYSSGWYEPGDDTGPGYMSSSGTTIKEKAHLCDLGITLRNSADFKQHITAKVSTLKNRVSWILRTFKTRDQIPMLAHWKQLALCEHDYCCQIRSPSRAEVQALEAVQMAFVKNIKRHSRLILFATANRDENSKWKKRGG